MILLALERSSVLRTLDTRGFSELSTALEKEQILEKCFSNTKRKDDHTAVKKNSKKCPTDTRLQDIRTHTVLSCQEQCWTKHELSAVFSEREL